MTTSSINLEDYVKGTGPKTAVEYSLGRKRPTVSGKEKTVLGNYIKKGLPTPPTSIDYTPKAAGGIAMILGNDALGDCVEAGIGHIEDVFLGNIGNTSWYTQADTISLYSASSGYNPSDPNTDQGSDEVTVLNYWKTNGIYPNKTGQCYDWVAVDGNNQNEIKVAINLFENVFFGIELPDEWVNPFPNATGFVWNVAGPANPNNGHAFAGLGYNDKGVIIATWGMIGIITWPAIAKYATTALQGELYTILSKDGIDKASQKAPNGFDFATLQADLTQLNSAPPPTPPPVPVPPPPAPPPVPVPPPPAPPPVPVPPTPVNYVYIDGFGNVTIKLNLGDTITMSGWLFNPVDTSGDPQDNLFYIQNLEKANIKQEGKDVVFTDIFGSFLRIKNIKYNTLLNNADEIFSFVD